MVERAVNDLSLRVDQVRAANEVEARELVLGLTSIRTAAEQYHSDVLGKLAQLEGRLEQIERQSDVGVASPAAKPVVQDPSGNTKPAAQLPTPSLTQLISKPGRQPAPSAKNKASVKPTSKDLHPSTDTKAIANWSVQDVSDEVAVLRDLGAWLRSRSETTYPASDGFWPSCTRGDAGLWPLRRAGLRTSGATSARASEPHRGARKHRSPIDRRLQLLSYSRCHDKGARTHNPGKIKCSALLAQSRGSFRMAAVR